MDVLVGAMDRFITKLRADFVADGSDAPGDGSVPADFWAFRAGFLKITRLRLVDCFGQTLDVPDPGAAPPGGPPRRARSCVRSR